MTNGFDPKTFDFKKQTAAHNLQTAGSGNANSWEHLWQLGGVKPWQMKYDEDDIRVAELAGASPYGLQQLLTEATSRGLGIGKNTTKQIDALRAAKPESFKAPINYGALGGYGFDTDDIKAMWGTGPANAQGVAYGMTSPEWTAGLDKVRDAWTWAQDQNLPNSSGVDTWIQNKENEQRDEKLRIETIRLAEEERLFQKGIADAAQASMQKAAEGAEYSRLASRRGGGNQTLSASGAATFKGRGLTSSENKRGKGRGTSQLRRPYGASGLSIAAGTGQKAVSSNLGK